MAIDALDLVVRARPPSPGLLEPYDLQRQFTILRALEPTPVPSPAVFWYEDSPDVLGREFYVMERVNGTVYERTVPPELASSPERLRRMSRSMVEAIASIHRVDLSDTGLDALGDGKGYLDRELDHWAGEMHRVQRATLPALERLLGELQERKPRHSTTVTLVHGDPKPGNFAFVGDEVSGVFDWELASLGDPLADIGWAELNWTMPGSFTRRPGASTPDELVALYEQLTGIDVVHRAVPRLPGVQDDHHPAGRRHAVRRRRQRRPAVRRHGARGRTRSRCRCSRRSASPPTSSPDRSPRARACPRGPGT